eukprot:GFYU01017574.1.p1 GENE.GFYU01017574.1~~GFYU01017574.1.p1  ORF type:complete len:294 (+),score=60.65 GFYU01017574.1:97-882(+)
MLMELDEQRLWFHECALRVAKHARAAPQAVQRWLENHTVNEGGNGEATNDAKWTVYVNPDCAAELSRLKFVVLRSDVRERSLLGNTMAGWVRTELCVCPLGTEFPDNYQQTVVQGLTSAGEAPRTGMPPNALRFVYEYESADSRTSHDMYRLELLRPGQEFGGDELVNVWTSQYQWDVDRSALEGVVQDLGLQNVLPLQFLCYVLMLGEARMPWDGSGFGPEGLYGANRAVGFFIGNYLHHLGQSGQIDNSDGVQSGFPAW